MAIANTKVEVEKIIKTLSKGSRLNWLTLNPIFKEEFPCRSKYIYTTEEFANFIEKKYKDIEKEPKKINRRKRKILIL